MPLRADIHSQAANFYIRTLEPPFLSASSSHQAAACEHSVYMCRQQPGSTCAPGADDAAGVPPAAALQALHAQGHGQQGLPDADSAPGGGTFFILPSEYTVYVGEVRVGGAFIP